GGAVDEGSANRQDWSHSRRDAGSGLAAASGQGDGDSCGEPEGGPFGGRERGTTTRGRRIRLDAGATVGTRTRETWRQPIICCVQSRALQSHSTGKFGAGNCAGQRIGNCIAAGTLCL